MRGARYGEVTGGGAEVVAEAGGWSVFVPGLPVAADGATVEEAVTEMVDALRDYAADWQEWLADVPNHRQNRQLRDWLVRLAR